jgi:diguanylate cyclase (GGDEF)-like protein
MRRAQSDLAAITTSRACSTSTPFTSGSPRSWKAPSAPMPALRCIFIDLDRFKDLNGSLGHQAGDVVTSAMGKRIANTARAMAMVARLGGNELAIIQMNADSIHKASALIHRIHEVLATRSSLTLSGSEWAIRSASSLGRSWMSTARA